MVGKDGFNCHRVENELLNLGTKFEKQLGIKTALEIL